MYTALIGKTFDADLCALYESTCGKNLEYGYYVEQDKNDGWTFYDLRKNDNSAVYACDGETCKVVDTGKSCVTIDCVESCGIPFLLSWEEFFVCADGLMYTVSDELQEFVETLDTEAIEDFCGFSINGIDKSDAIYEAMTQMPDGAILDYYQEFFG